MVLKFGLLYLECESFLRFEAAAEDYQKLLNQECVESTPYSSPTHQVTDENMPSNQVAKTETEQHMLGFMADQVTI
jgi:hypothetical protein